MALEDYPIVGDDNRTILGYERRGEVMVVEGPDGKRYFLAIHPFKYRPIADPGSPETLHPGPARAGEIAVVPVPPALQKINGQFRIVPADVEAGPRPVPRVPVEID